LGQADEALQHASAIGVETDMMPVRPFAGRDGSPAEIERAADIAVRERRKGHLDHVGVGDLALLLDLGQQGGDIDLGIGQRL
jgi:hypothetical protein